MCNTSITFHIQWAVVVTVIYELVILIEHDIIHEQGLEQRRCFTMDTS